MKKSTVSFKKMLIIKNIDDRNYVSNDGAYNINIAWNIACN